MSTYRLVPLEGGTGMQEVEGKREAFEIAQEIADRERAGVHVYPIGGYGRTLVEPGDDWTPEYSPWRHGGWYVDNVRYPSGAVGCVSRNYSDRKWRIVCDNRTGDFTYPNRDAAARAERALAASLVDATRRGDKRSLIA